jgi:hypothetical protein
VRRNCRSGDASFMGCFRVRVQINHVNIFRFAFRLLEPASSDAGILSRFEENPRL